MADNNKQVKRPKIKTFYSATAKVDMGALDLSFNSKDGSVYLKMAPQVGYHPERKGRGEYAWKDSTNVKLDVGEVGAILRAIRKDSEFSFIHDFGGTKVTGSFKYWQTDKSSGFGVSVKKGEKPIKVSLSLGDAELIGEYLRFALDHIFSADYAAEKAYFKALAEKKGQASPEVEDKSSDLPPEVAGDGQGVEEDSPF